MSGLGKVKEEMMATVEFTNPFNFSLDDVYIRMEGPGVMTPKSKYYRWAQRRDLTRNKSNTLKVCVGFTATTQSFYHLPGFWFQSDPAAVLPGLVWDFHPGESWQHPGDGYSGLSCSQAGPRPGLFHRQSLRVTYWRLHVWVCTSLLSLASAFITTVVVLVTNKGS